VIDLVFRRLRSGTHPVDLVFGEPAGPVVDAAGTLDIALPSFAPSFDGLLDYDLAVSGSDVIGTAASWQPAVPVIAPTLHARHATGQQTRIARRAPWGRGQRVVGDLRSAWQQLDSMLSHLRPGWQAGEPLHAAADSAWQQGIPLPRASRTPWQSGVATRTGAASGWAVADILRSRPRGVPWGAGHPTTVRVQSSAQSAAPAWQRPLRIRWTSAEPLPAGRSVITVPPVEPPWRCYTSPAGGAVHLLFDTRRPVGLDILFSCGAGTPAGTVVIPIRSTYIVINDVTLVRLPDNTAINAYSLSLKWDVDSWSVGWSASLPAAALDAVMPSIVGEPVELQATINGTAVRLLTESIARDRRFGDARLSVSGRGRVAWLADPYAQAVARTAATDMTAQQLSAESLTQNGVPVGWALDWQLADWLVPAGVWSHQGTMIDAVKRIAEAAGGYVLGHRTAQTLHVRPRYPLLPWEWAGATPDIVIPSAVASTEAITWSESPAYNRVFVAGQEQGRMGQITRSGTAGDIVAPMITDPLITHADAARARGASILAAGGRQATVSLRLPVLPATGIIDIGKLVEYQDGSDARRGLVRSVSVEAGRPNVWQTVEIETHA